ncbi:hypothetical protein GCM10027091_07530 [Streptomyces daliensis]
MEAARSRGAARAVAASAATVARLLYGAGAGLREGAWAVRMIGSFLPVRAARVRVRTGAPTGKALLFGVGGPVSGLRTRCRERSRPEAPGEQAGARSCAR